MVQAEGSILTQIYILSCSNLRASFFGNLEQKNNVKIFLNKATTANLTAEESHTAGRLTKLVGITEEINFDNYVQLTPNTCKFKQYTHQTLKTCPSKHNQQLTTNPTEHVNRIVSRLCEIAH